jgi:hypothetical protein
METSAPAIGREVTSLGLLSRRIGTLYQAALCRSLFFGLRLFDYRPFCSRWNVSGLGRVACSRSVWELINLSGSKLPFLTSRHLVLTAQTEKGAHLHLVHRRANSCNNMNLPT